MPNERNPFAVRSGGRAGQPVAAKPKAVSTPNGGLNTAVKTGDKNRGNRIASALGRAGAAVIGDAAHPFAQIGNLIAGEAEEDIFSSTVSDLLEGKDISQVDTRGLSPEQISEAMRLKKEGQATKLGTTKEVLSQLKQISTLEGLSEAQRTLLSRNVFTSAGLEVDEEAIEGISGESVGETQEGLLKTESDLKIEQIQAQAKEDAELIDARGGVDKVIAGIRAETQLDVAAMSGLFRQLGIQTDIAGKVDAEDKKRNADPTFRDNLAAAITIFQALPQHPDLVPTEEESLATISNILRALKEGEFADQLSKKSVVEEGASEAAAFIQSQTRGAKKSDTR
jgi:hypothetical protein